MVGTTGSGLRQPFTIDLGLAASDPKPSFNSCDKQTFGRRFCFVLVGRSYVKRANVTKGNILPAEVEPNYH